MRQLVFTFYSPKCIEETKIMINGAINQINGDGTEQVYTSTTIHRETWFDSWMSIGSTTAETKFSNKALAVVRYTNGATFEGELSKKSPVYHEIMANMSLYKTTIG